MQTLTALDVAFAKRADLIAAVAIFLVAALCLHWILGKTIREFITLLFHEMTASVTMTPTWEGMNFVFGVIGIVFFFLMFLSYTVVEKLFGETSQLSWVAYVLAGFCTWGFFGFCFLLCNYFRFDK
jgi:uncharacterized membrane protein YuzA (DUF378 family)